MNAQNSEQGTTTAQLVAAAQKGSKSAIDGLFRRHAPTVRRIVALRMGQPVHSMSGFDDIAQEAMLKVFQSLDGFEYRSEGSFRNFLATCVRSAIADYHRVANAHKRGGGRVRVFAECGTESLSASLFRGHDPSPSEVVRAKEFEARLEEALLELDEHHREVIILRKILQLDYADVARELGFEKEATARQVCKRALAKLRSKLGL